jgi:hypothetical protein
MKTLLIITHIILRIVSIQEPDPGEKITCHYTDIAFTEFCNDLTRLSGVKIFFDESEVKQLKVTLHADSISVISAIESALSGTGFSVSVWHNSLLILKGGRLLSSLPSYESEAGSNFEHDKTSILTESEERYIRGRKPGDAEVITVGKSSFGITNVKVKVLGKVTEEETGEPMIGATMFVEELSSGTVTDQNGFLSYALKPGKYKVRFEYMGFEKKNCLLEVYSSGEFRIEMKKVVISIQEVVVYGDRQNSITSKDPGLERISINTVREIPTMIGERDILKVSEMLPGIVSVGEGSSGLNVRGGSSDQNVFYINKIPVYNTSHLFGFFPAFNSDIVKDFSVYKGHVPAEFGGRLSSVFNIITRQGNRKRYNIHGGINPVTGNITIEGPLLKDKSSFLVSARSSYSDWILRQIKDPVIRESSAQFNDVAVSLNYDFKNSQLGFFAFNSNDFFRLSDINRYQYSNSGASLNLRHTFSADLQGELSLIGARYSFETVDKQEPSVAYQHGYEIEHYEIRIDFNHHTLGKHSVEYGAGYLLNALDRGTVLPYGEESLTTTLMLGKEKGMEGSVYLSDRVDLLPWLNIALGVRYSLYVPLGPKTVYTYLPGMPMDSRYLDDSLTFGNNKPIRWYSSPELRAAINFATDKDGSVKLAFNQMHQNIFMLNNTITIAPNTQWKLADYYLRPGKSNQVSLGIFRNYPGRGWETSAEIFYKSTRNFPEFRDGADFLDDTQVESQVLQGNQKAYGVELSVKSSGHQLSGWLAYTWSRSLSEINGGQSWNSINGGESYPANYDIPHALNTLITYSPNRRLNMSTVFTYQSGRPITYPLSVYYIDGIPITDYSNRNKYNIPDYFRMDLSVTIEGNLRKNKMVHSSFVFSIYNLTGRRNPYSVYFKSERGIINSYKYSVIGVPVFTATWIFKLGNYASE